MPSTQVIIACLNEEEGIGSTISEILNQLDDVQILVVDGWSHDRSIEIAKNLGAEIVFQDGQGKGDAIAKAIKYIDPYVDYVAFTDADYTYPTHRLPEMIQKLEENPEVGMVSGNRFNHHLEKTALKNIFYMGNRLIAFSHNLLNGIALRDPLTGLRVVRADILRDWAVKSKGFDVEVELNHHVERKGYRMAELDIAYRPRLGEKKLKLRHGATILKRIMTEATY